MLDRTTDGWIMTGERATRCHTHLRRALLVAEPETQPDLFGDLTGSRRRLVISDSGFSQANKVGLTALLDRYGLDYTLVEIGPGESCKTAETHDRLLTALHDFRVVHHLEPVIVVGGGAAHDAGGFACSNYDRGVDYRFYGTTGTAAWDAGPAWKVGAHWGTHRNGRGAYHPATDFYFGRDTINTLDRRSLIESTAEAIKIAVIRDRDLLDLIRRTGAELVRDKLQGSTRDLECRAGSLVHRAVRGILAEISKQPYENSSNLRPSWLGHNFPLIELEAGIMHGEAVCLDMLVTLLIQHGRGGLPLDEVRVVVDACRAVGLPLWHPVLERTDVLAESLRVTTAHRWGEQQIPVTRRLGEEGEVEYLNGVTISEVSRNVADLYEIAH